MGRSRGGLTTKIHALVDAAGLPIRLELTEGQAHDNPVAVRMIDTLAEGDILLADRAYDSDALRAKAESLGAWANVKERQPQPASPYRRDPADVPDYLIFDRDTGEIVPKSWLRSYADVLRTYHRSPETKFIGGGGHQIGSLHRRHVFADAIQYIGKEADSFEEAEEYGEEEDSVTLYGAVPVDGASMVAKIAAAPVAKLKIKAKVGHGLIERVVSGDLAVSDRVVIKLYKAALAIEENEKREAIEAAVLFSWAKAWANHHSPAELARLLPHDPSNLAKAFKAGTLGKALAAKVKHFKQQLESESNDGEGWTRPAPSPISHHD